MTQRYQFACTLGCHDAGDACDGKHIPFRNAALLDKCERAGRHADGPLGDCFADAFAFLGHVDHPGVARCVKVREGEVAW